MDGFLAFLLYCSIIIKVFLKIIMCRWLWRWCGRLRVTLAGTVASTDLGGSSKYSITEKTKTIED